MPVTHVTLATPHATAGSRHDPQSQQQARAQKIQMQGFPISASGGSKAALKSALNNTHVVVERRAADILVLGDSAIASAACTSLARRGRKVIHLPDMGLVAPRQRAQEALKPLILPDPDVRLTSLANDASSYFQGMQLQANTPLLAYTGSVDLATARTSIREQQTVAQAMADLLARLADNSRSVGIKTRPVSGTDVPLLRLEGTTRGLLQVDGAVVNAVAVSGALRSLSQRSGVTVRDNLTLRGWQDTGSCLRVRASSTLQPDAWSIFEAEQVLLAPGDWSVDCLRMWNIGTQMQYRSRPSLRCTGSPDLAKLPLVRHWHTPSPHPTPSTAATPRTPPATTQPVTKQAAIAPPSAQEAVVVDQHWVLFPASGAARTCKLTGVDPGQQIVNSCWDLQPVTGAADGDTDTEGDSQVLVEGWQRAEGVVRGLGRPVGMRAPGEGDMGEEEDGGGGREAAQGRGKGLSVQVAWDMVTPDGLPVLGWHPAFESGRVLVACTAGSPAQPSVPAAGHSTRATTSQPIPASSSGESQSLRTAAPLQQQRAAEATAPRRAPVVKAQDGEELQVVVGGAQHDGWHLSPVLGKAAADMLVGVPTLDLPLDVSELAVGRPQLTMTAQGGIEGCVGTALLVLDPWEGLQEVQSGAWHQKQRVARMSEDERQAWEEEQFMKQRNLTSLVKPRK